MPSHSIKSDSHTRTASYVYARILNSKNKRPIRSLRRLEFYIKENFNSLPTSWLVALAMLQLHILYDCLGDYEQSGPLAKRIYSFFGQIYAGEEVWRGPGASEDWMERKVKSLERVLRKCQYIIVDEEKGKERVTCHGADVAVDDADIVAALFGNMQLRTREENLILENKENRKQEGDSEKDEWIWDEDGDDYYIDEEEDEETSDDDDTEELTEVDENERLKDNVTSVDDPKKGTADTMDIDGLQP